MLILLHDTQFHVADDAGNIMSTHQTELEAYRWLSARNPMAGSSMCMVGGREISLPDFNPIAEEHFARQSRAALARHREVVE